LAAGIIALSDLKVVIRANVHVWREHAGGPRGSGHRSRNIQQGQDSN